MLVGINLTTGEAIEYSVSLGDIAYGLLTKTWMGAGRFSGCELTTIYVGF